METVTFKMAEADLDEIDAEADEKGVTRSEYIRTIIESRDDTSDHERTIEQYERTIDEHERTIERLQNEKQLILERDQETRELRLQHEELIDTIKQERSITQEKAQAGVLTRTKWWITGLPTERAGVDD